MARIGKAIGKRAEALGMKVLPYDVLPQPGLVDFDTHADARATSSLCTCR